MFAGLNCIAKDFFRTRMVINKRTFETLRLVTLSGMIAQNVLFLRFLAL